MLRWEALGEACEEDGEGPTEMEEDLRMLRWPLEGISGYDQPAMRTQSRFEPLLLDQIPGRQSGRWWVGGNVHGKRKRDRERRDVVTEISSSTEFTG